MRFTNNFNFLRTLQTGSQRMLRIFTMPLYTVYRQAMRYINPNGIMSRVTSDVRKGFRKITKGKPASLADYFSLPQHYVAKKLVIIIALLLLLLPIAYIYLLHPIVQSNFLTKTMYVNATEMIGYSGKVELLSNNTGELFYEGKMEEGRITGEGTVYGVEGNPVYTGGFLMEMYEGTGESYYPDGTVQYTGAFSKNKYEGQGILYTEGGRIKYEGEFKGGVYSGMGKEYYDNGQLMFSGNFENGEPSGNGTIYGADGSIVYEGDLLNGKFEGTGTIYQNGKPLYYGGFIDGKMSGEGEIYSDGNVIYKGAFADNNYSGAGKLYDPVTLALMYDGEFAAGKYSGAGRLYDTEENLLYEGQFYEGNYEGDGTLYDVDTEFPIYTGTFRNGRYDGAGTEYEFGTGLVVYEGEFLLGEYSGDGKIYNTASGLPLYEGPFIANYPASGAAHVIIGGGSTDGAGEDGAGTDGGPVFIPGGSGVVYEGPAQEDGSIDYVALSQMAAEEAIGSFGIQANEWQLDSGNTYVYEDATENIGLTVQIDSSGNMLGIDVWNDQGVSGAAPGMTKAQIIEALGEPDSIDEETMGENRLVSISQSNRFHNRLTNISANSNVEIYNYATEAGNIRVIFIKSIDEALIVEIR